MINGLGVVGWGVGGIEAEAAMLGQPMSMLIPEVVGVRISGRLPAGSTATDAVLTVTQLLRKRNVVGKFVEFFGPGLSDCRSRTGPPSPTWRPNTGPRWLFPRGQETLAYLRLTGRSPKNTLSLLKPIARPRDCFRTDQSPDPFITDVLELDLNEVVPSLAGPKRPQDRVSLKRRKPPSKRR
jgi:aconitate hydratase